MGLKMGLKIEIRMYNKKVILQCLVKYWILFALVFVLQKPYWTSRTKTRANKIPYFTKHCKVSHHK